MTSPTDPGAPQGGDRGGLVQPTLRLDLQRHGDALVLDVGGEIDLITQPLLSRALTDALATRPALLIVDLQDVGFLSSVGLSALLNAHHEAEKNGTEVRVVANERVVRRPIQLTGVDRVVTLYADRETALGH